MEFKLKELKSDILVTRIANIHYFEFTSKYYTKLDKHPFCELVYVDSGRINVVSRGYKGVLNQNQMIIHKSGEIHSLSCMGDESANVIIIGFEYNQKKITDFSKKIKTLNNDEKKILTDIVKEGRNVFMPPYDVPNLFDMKKKKDIPYGAEQLIKIKLEEFLINLVRDSEIISNNNKKNVLDFRFDDVYNYILENYKEKISLDDLCFLFNTNKTTLCSSFKEAFGKTITTLINEQRIKYAKKLIREDTYSLSQISQMAGFSSVHYFSKVFKDFAKMTASDYLISIKSKLEQMWSSFIDKTLKKDYYISIFSWKEE